MARWARQQVFVLAFVLVLGGCSVGVIGVSLGDGGTTFRDGGTTFRDGAASHDGGPLADRAISADVALDSDAATLVDSTVGHDSALVQDGATGSVVPPLGGSSGGSGGPTAPSGESTTASGVTFILMAPSSIRHPARCMVVYSGTETDDVMAANLRNVAPMSNLQDVIFAVLDGVTYRGNGAAGATVLDWLRSHYDIDNDRTFLLSESAGTTAGLQLGFHLRQSYFAAYWVNDVNASDSPQQNATQLGFAPWGNAGPGGDFTDANAIVSAMQSAGYRLPSDAPYSGSGAGTHGSADQFTAAMGFFDGKSR